MSSLEQAESKAKVAPTSKQVNFEVAMSLSIIIVRCDYALFSLMLEDQF
jgi:hypothetical protein